MALTVKTGTNGLTIIFDGSTAWEYNDEAPNGLRIESLEFKPTQTDDICVVREDGVLGGRIIFSEKAATAYDNKIKYFNTENGKRYYKPYVVGAEFSNGGILIINYC